MGELPHNIIDIGYLAVVAFLAYLGLRLKNIILQNKIDIMNAIENAFKEQKDFNGEVETHIATDKAEHKEMFRRLDKLELFHRREDRGHR